MRLPAFWCVPGLGNIMIYEVGPWRVLVIRLAENLVDWQRGSRFGKRGIGCMAVLSNKVVDGL